MASSPASHADWSYDATMEAVKHSLEACLDAGYGLLHLDPTTDRRPPDETIPVDDLVARTAELLTHAEAYRKGRMLSPVAYEIGTEEVRGGPESVQRFRMFLNQLDAALAERDLPRPHFVVGDIGTRLDSAHVNTARTEQLTQIARRHNALVKGHYTDGVVDLAAYPRCGIGGANVKPGLAAAEYDALMDLVHLEQSLGRDAGFPDALRTAVIESGRWTKWLRPEEAGLAFDDLAPERQTWIVGTGSRYVWTQPAVEAARARLYDHVAPCVRRVAHQAGHPALPARLQPGGLQRLAGCAMADVGVGVEISRGRPLITARTPPAGLRCCAPARSARGSPCARTGCAPAGR